MISIYKITNRYNNKIYIGQTRKSIETRLEEHIKSSHHSNLKLSRAIKKYGREAFSIELLEKSSSQEEANESEKRHICFSNSTNDLIGYNIAPGGQGGDIKTKHQKECLSAYMKTDNNPIRQIMDDPELFSEWKSKVSKGTRKRIVILFKMARTKGS